MMKKDIYIAKDGTKIPYRIYVPTEKPKNEKYPIYFNMHGAGECGTDNEAQLNTSLPLMVSLINNKEEPCIVVAPQCTDINIKWVSVESWTNESAVGLKDNTIMSALIDLINELGKKYPIDENRRYVGGNSMGGFATWQMIMHHPDMFAAAVPICGGGDITLVEKIKDIPIKTFHSSDDNDVTVENTRSLYTALKKIGANCEYTEYNNLGHGCWDVALSTDGLMDWMLSQHK